LTELEHTLSAPQRALANFRTCPGLKDPIGLRTQGIELFKALWSLSSKARMIDIGLLGGLQALFVDLMKTIEYESDGLRMITSG
jgi:hypothetical protein